MDFLPALDEIADSRTIERGRGYFREGRVVKVELSGDRIAAEVIGSGRSTYTAHIQLDIKSPDGIDFACDCPVGETGDFCKHLVALALTWQSGSVDKSNASPYADLPPSNVGPAPMSPTTRLRKTAQTNACAEEWLDQQDAAKLRLLWREAMVQSGEARQFIAARAATGSQDPQALDEAVSELLKRRGGSYLDYYGSDDYARQIDPVVDLLRNAVAGNPDAALKIAEKTVKRLNRAMLTADDSNGSIGGVMWACQEVWCEALIAQDERPAKKRASAFIDFDDLQEFTGDGLYLPLEKLPVDHPLLDELYRQSRERLAVLGSKKGKGRQDIFHQRLRAQRFAERVGDVDGWIAIELSHTERNPAVATAMEKLEAAGRRREAIALAERYLARKDGAINKTGIRETLARLLHADGLTAEAIEHVWTNFAESPSEHAYRALMRFLHAVREPTPRQKQWREKALALSVARGKGKAKAKGAAASDDVTLAVEILMAQQRYRDAWQMWSPGSMLNNFIAERLAREGAQYAPDRAMKIVADIAEHMLEQRGSTNNANYDTIVAKLDGIREGCAAASPKAGHDWRSLVERLRDANLRKPNFVARMNALLAAAVVVAKNP